MQLPPRSQRFHPHQHYSVLFSRCLLQSIVKGNSWKNAVKRYTYLSKLTKVWLTFSSSIVFKSIRDGINLVRKAKESATTTNNSTFLNRSLKPNEIIRLKQFMRVVRITNSSGLRKLTFVPLRAASNFSFFSLRSVSVCPPTFKQDSQDH